MKNYGRYEETGCGVGHVHVEFIGVAISFESDAHQVSLMAFECRPNVPGDSYKRGMGHFVEAFCVDYPTDVHAFFFLVVLVDDLAHTTTVGVVAAFEIERPSWVLHVEYCGAV